MDKKLLDAEWTILKAMWDREPMTMKEIIAQVQEQQPDTVWQYKTYHSYLRIMLEKGLIGCKEKNLRDKLYFPIITRGEAIKTESETLLSRISASSMGALVAAMVQSAPLSQAEKQELQKIAQKLESVKEGEEDGR